jgi:signal transduction histidine kinase
LRELSFRERKLKEREKGSEVMQRSCKKTGTVLAVMFVLVLGCGKDVRPVESGDEGFPFASFRNVPGVTAQEIAAIEALWERYDYFVYGVDHTIEAFPVYAEQKNGNGKYAVGGYAARLCVLLTELFGIPFVPTLYSDDWDNLLAEFENGNVHFMGDLMFTEERKDTHFMTTTIAERLLTAFQIEGVDSITEIAKSRPPRLAFPHDFILRYDFMDLAEYAYEMVFTDDYAHAYRLISGGEVDAFVAMNTAEPTMSGYGNVVSETFSPLVFAPVSLATQNRDLIPIISVVQKMLDNGGRFHLARLYSLGQYDYIRNKLSEQLSGEERKYIRNNPIVKIASEVDNYPLSFYNDKDGEYQGVSFDILKELSLITGLSFEIGKAMDMGAGFRDLTEMVENNEASFIPYLRRSKEREERFLFTEVPIIKDYPVLISKSEFPNVNFNELSDVTVGLVRGSVHSELFKRWFVNDAHFREYDNLDDAFRALERGKVDMLMSGATYFLSMENYKELAGYKINVAFDHQYDLSIGLNKNEAILCAILDKALQLIDLETIAGNWMNKRFDYRAKMMAARLPWLIGAITLSLIVLSLILVMFLRSLSEEKRLVKLVEEKTIEARSASEAKSRFIANMSHEMRTPMNVIVGLTDLMLEEDDISGKTKETLKKINTAGVTLTGLINDVLDISKVEAGKMDLIPVEYDVPSLLNDIITLNMIRIREKPVAFRLEVDGDLPCTLYGDDLRVKQILNNLLSNAFKYTDQGTVVLKIGCRFDANSSAANSVWVFFSVSDSGIGIHKEDLEKLFTDYHQVDTQANRKIEGTGLGLSITKRFVELMDGEITAQSEYGRGSIFRVRIRQGFVDHKIVSKETLENLNSFNYSAKKKKDEKRLVRADLSHAAVLVVDDFPSNLDVAAGMLCKYKMRVDCVTSGREAVDLIGAGKPVYDVLFMDHMMPGMDGMEAVALIRAIDTEYAKKVPIIALTANAVTGSEEMFLSNGFNAFLAKPLSVVALDSVVRQWIRKQ